MGDGRSAWSHVRTCHRGLPVVLALDHHIRCCPAVRYHLPSRNVPSGYSGAENSADDS